MRLATKRLLLSALESQETCANPSPPISEVSIICLALGAQSRELIMKVVLLSLPPPSPSCPSHQGYYTCDINRLGPHLAPYWRGLELDQETRGFLSESRRKSANVCLQLLYGAVYLFLCMFLSFTDING